jgi:hypothetical protein
MNIATSDLLVLSKPTRVYHLPAVSTFYYFYVLLITTIDIGQKRKSGATIFIDKSKAVSTLVDTAFIYYFGITH